MIGSGSDRKWLTPLDTQGNANPGSLGVEDDVTGCHAGAYSGLNVCNAQPGFEYQWPLNPMGVCVRRSKQHKSQREARWSSW